MYQRSLSILHTSLQKETWAICCEKRKLKKRELEKMMKQRELEKMMKKERVMSKKMSSKK
jgi:hypothetical protein